MVLFAGVPSFPRTAASICPAIGGSYPCLVSRNVPEPMDSRSFAWRNPKRQSALARRGDKTLGGALGQRPAERPSRLLRGGWRGSEPLEQERSDFRGVETLGPTARFVDTGSVNGN